MLKNIANFNNINDYLPLLNAVLITDIFVILLLNSKVISIDFLMTLIFLFRTVFFLF